MKYLIPAAWLTILYLFCAPARDATIAWDPSPTPGVQRYPVEVQQADGSWQQVSQPTGTEHTLTGLPDDAAVNVRVRAKKDGLVSVPTPPLTIPVPPPPPPEPPSNLRIIINIRAEGGVTVEPPRVR